MVKVVIQSVAFPFAFLRMDASGISSSMPTGGIVNCQFGFGSWETWDVEESNNITTIQSDKFPNVFLRMDGSNVPPTGGVINCQYGKTYLTEFRLSQSLESIGPKSVESVATPNVFLRMDGEKVKKFQVTGSGVVDCNPKAAAWEMFNLLPVQGDWK